MNLLQSIGPRRRATDIVIAIEPHSVEQIREALDAGVDARAPIRGKSPSNWLTEMYSRGDDFPKCLRLLLDRGGVLDDPALAPVLLNDTDALESALRAKPSLLEHRTNMISPFTPLAGATLLHVAAEYGHADVAHLLIERGADVNAKASVEEYGLNGHTPIFHTVNSSSTSRSSSSFAMHVASIATVNGVSQRSALRT